MMTNHLIIFVLVLLVAFVLYYYMQKNKSKNLFSDISCRRPNISLAQNRILETSGF